MSRLTCLWNVLFLAAGGLLAQTVLPVKEHRDLQVRVSAGEQQIRLVHEFDGKALVVVGPRVLSDASSVAYYQGSDGAKQPVTPVGVYIGGAVAADGRWVFLSVGNGISLTGAIVDMTTGQLRSLPTQGVPRASAVHGDLVAVSTEWNGQSQVSLFKCDSGALIGSVPLPVVVPATELYFAGPERLLIVDAGKIKVYNVRISDALKFDTSYELSGPDLSDVRDRAPRAVAVRGFSRGAILVHGYATSKSGDDLFFVSAPKGKVGVRMIQCDSSGRQTASYLLVDEAWKEPGTLHVEPQFIQVSEERISVLTQKGIASSFDRP